MLSCTGHFIRAVICLLMMLVLTGCTDLGFGSSSDHVEKGYYSSVSLWPSLDVPVCWENLTEVTDADRALVRQAVDGSWAAAVPFNFYGWGACEPNSKGIRIKGEDSNPRAYLGTDIDGVENGMYLNFTFNNFGRPCRRSESERQACIKLVAVHEFGHAIGIDHEQERDDTPEWCRDREAKYGYGGDTEVGAWDVESVMNYCNPEWAGNGELSDGDIETVRTAYRSLLEEGSTLTQDNERPDLPEDESDSLDCLPLLNCVEDCYVDSCVEDCYRIASDEAISEYERLESCRQGSWCRNMSCLQVECPEEVDACLD